MLCPVYISEISPPKHRGLLASTFQLAIVFGILLSLISNYLLLNIGENNWRWMLFSGALPAVAFFIMLFFIRKSPRWLVKKGRIEEARKNIEDLSSHEIDTEQTILEIQESINIEDAGKRINLFKRPYRKIIFIGIFVGIISQLTGIGVVFYYSAQIFSIAGFSSDTSMLQSVILGLTNLIFTLLAMVIIDKVGRKKLLLTGQLGMVTVLGLFGYGLLSGNITGYWLVALLVAYIAFFACITGCSDMGIAVRNVSECYQGTWCINRIFFKLGGKCFTQFFFSHRSRNLRDNTGCTADGHELCLYLPCHCDTYRILLSEEQYY